MSLKSQYVLASCVRNILAHCTAIVLLVFTNGPVKMFVAVALDEMMAGPFVVDCIDPETVSVLAADVLIMLVPFKLPVISTFPVILYTIPVAPDVLISPICFILVAFTILVPFVNAIFPFTVSKVPVNTITL